MSEAQKTGFVALRPINKLSRSFQNTRQCRKVIISVQILELIMLVHVSSYTENILVEVAAELLKITTQCVR